MAVCCRRAEGGHVQAVYSPLDALQLARRHPELHVVFFAVGFETTTPTTALAVRQAAALAVENFSLLVAHVRVLPAMQAIAAAADCRVQAFLAAGHVCTVAGSDDYGPFAAQYGMPVVVTGFEPVDLLRGILECVQQLEAGRATVANCYARTAHTAGNTAAPAAGERCLRSVRSALARHGRDSARRLAIAAGISRL